MEQSLAALAGQVPLYLLSNTSGLHKDYLLRTFPIFRHFADGVYSYSARSSKPEEAIFQQAIERFDLDPALTFYVDDLEPNIATARRLGFDAFLYDLNRHDLFEAALEAWKVRHGLSLGAS
jgi:putative hydrolase of the HAD superfamily